MRARRFNLSNPRTRVHEKALDLLFFVVVHIRLLVVLRRTYEPFAMTFFKVHDLPSSFVSQVFKACTVTVDRFVPYFGLVRLPSFEHVGDHLVKRFRWRICFTECLRK